MDAQYTKRQINNLVKNPKPSTQADNEWWRRAFAGVCFDIAGAVLFDENVNVAELRDMLQPLKPHWPLS